MSTNNKFTYGVLMYISELTQLSVNWYKLKHPVFVIRRKKALVLTVLYWKNKFHQFISVVVEVIDDDTFTNKASHVIIKCSWTNKTPSTKKKNALGLKNQVIKFI